MKRCLLLFAVLLCSWPVLAQLDNTLYHMRYLSQSSYMNPVFVPECKLNIGVPVLSGIAFRSGWSGFTWNDLVDLGSDDSLTFTVDNALDVMKDRNFFEIENRVDFLHVGFAITDADYFSFNASARQYYRVTMTDDFFRLLWEGNGKSFVGDRVSLDGTGADQTLWIEYAAAYSRGVNKNLTIGGRFKYLQGLTNIWTKESELGLTTDANTYALDMQGNMEFYSSGFFGSADSLEIFGDGINFDFKNSGFATDLGLAYQFKEKVELSMSVMDLGYITWKERNRNWFYNDVDLQFSGFDGFGGTITSNPDGGTGASIDSLETTLSQLRDSLEEAFDPIRDSSSYTTWLPTRFNFGARWDIGDRQYLGGLFSLSWAKGRPRASVSMAYNLRFRRKFGLAVSYSVYNRSYFNVGTGLSVNLGPVQYHMIFDNVLAPLMPQNVKNIHARMGLNLNFGCKEPRRVKRPGF